MEFKIVPNSGEIVALDSGTNKKMDLYSSYT